MYVYTFDGFAFQLNLLSLIIHEIRVKSGHRMWTEDYTMTDELNPRHISYNVIDE